MKRPGILKRFRRRRPDGHLAGFDPDFYRRRYPDVDASGLGPSEHYLTIGRGERRDPNAHFSAEGYLRAHPDVAAAGFDALTHFFRHGLASGYGGWQRGPDDAVPAADDGRRIPSQDGGIAQWNQAFADFVRRRIDRLHARATEAPDDANVRVALDYHWFHERRWGMTFRTLSPLTRAGDSIIEVGGASVISHFLASRGMRVAGTDTDLRNPLDAVADATHDVVLCLEVIEHIKDQDGSAPVDIFNGSGVRCLISEMYRICKPGGIVVCTTPNACATSSIARSVRMEAPMFFRKHVREFTPDELRDGFEEAGFETLRLETPPDPWGQPPELDLTAVAWMIVQAGGGTALREDDIVAVFRRPS